MTCVSCALYAYDLRFIPDLSEVKAKGEEGRRGGEAKAKGEKAASAPRVRLASPRNRPRSTLGG